MYDLEALVPVSKKYESRLPDFKKLGLLNVGPRKVLLNLLVSNGEDIPDLDSGWPDGVDVKIQRSPQGPDYIQNMFNFYLDYNSFGSRWLMRMDDDSCTDVHSLVSNLDEFYDSEDKYYLAAGMNMQEWHDCAERYLGAFGSHKKIIGHIGHETECCVVSRGCLKHALCSEKARGLLQVRAGLKGGVGDCAFAFACALAKVYAIECPFLSPAPELDNFSFSSGGLRCHIHMVSRGRAGETFGDQRISSDGFSLLEKIVDGRPTEFEASLVGKRFVSDGNEGIFLYEFCDRYKLRVKFDDAVRFWMHDEGVIKIFKRDFLEHSLEVVGPKLVGEKLNLIPLAI